MEITRPRAPAELGLPMVAKPRAEAQATYRLDTTEDFASWLRAAEANSTEVWLLEEFLTGREHTFDSAGSPRPDHQRAARRARPG